MDSEIVTTIPAGQRVDVGECYGAWCTVMWDGRSGYAIGENLDIGASLPQAQGYHHRLLDRPDPSVGGDPGGVEDMPVYDDGLPRVYAEPSDGYSVDCYCYEDGF